MQSSVTIVADKQDQSEFQQVYAKALRLLAMREHSTLELTNKLMNKSRAGKEAEPSVVYAVIENLQQENYLSDERFTESYVRFRQIKGFGPIKIRQELQQKGVPNTLVDEYVKNQAAQWYENAESQYHKKYGDTHITDYNTWSKQARFLQSRGFTSEQIQATIPPVDYE